MENIHQSKALFIGLSAMSIGCLVGSFGYPLLKLELYRQVETSAFNVPVARTYIVSETATNFPYGFQKDKAKLFAQIHHDYKLQKILLLSLAGICSTTAMYIGKTLIPQIELEDQVSAIRNDAKRELSLKAIKHHFALANKSQQLLFLDEMKSLMEEFGSMESEIMDADELNALYENTAEGQSNESESSAEEPVFRKQFPESMDATSWKAIQKARQSGASKEEIVKNVLGCSEEIGLPYMTYLEQRF